MRKQTKGSFLTSENVIILALFVWLFASPLFMSLYKLNIYEYYFSQIIVALSITFVWGYTGIFSFGQAAFMALASYIYGVLGQSIMAGSLTPLAAVITIVIVMLVGAILGYFMFYGGVNDVFVGVITLCAGVALETFFTQTADARWKVFGVKLGGFNGMTGIPMLQVFGHKLSHMEFYYLALISMVLIYIALRILITRKAGYAMVAIRENRSRCELLGYNVPFIQCLVFSISVGIAAYGGVLYGSWGGYVAPGNMSMSSSIIPVLIVASGGRKNATAAVVFGMFYYIFSSKLSASGSSWNYIILGTTFLLVLLLLPQGIVTTIIGLLDRKVFHRKRVAADQEV